MNRPNRREFLPQLAIGGVAAAVALGAGARVAAAAGRKMKIAFTPGSIRVKANQAQAIELADKHGFEAVQPFPNDLGALSGADLKKLLEDLKRRNLVWAAAGLPVDYRRDEARFEEGMKKFPDQVKALERAGVTRMGTWLSPAHAQLTHLRNLKQTGRRLRQVAAVVGDHGMRLGLEYVGTKRNWTRERYAFVHTMAETKELIAEIGASNVGFVMDSWHWWTAGDTVADILTLTNKDIVSADLNDAPKGIPRDEQFDNQRELPMATGVIDVGAFLNALNKVGYDGPVRAEPFNAALAKLPPDEACAATAAAMKKAFALISD